MRINIILLYIYIFTLLSCERKIEKETVIYFNDFEGTLTGELTGAVQHVFNGEQMLGNYNGGGFSLHLSSVPEHRYMLISFDLYIHDSWDGNSISPNGPDLWTLQLNALLHKSNPAFKFETSFSNSPCVSSLCYEQSFPDEFPFIHSPRFMSDTETRGLCHLAGSPTGTTIYHIEKGFRSSDQVIFLDFYDRLVQTNVANPVCDESWSLDNLRISVLN
ncbi:hypothetical protein [Roseivirga misakiensis]|uniref:Lipoprotein n=1 Tax=Roseivirga misakiensis TaxID=1563681 RepID=A0A1E5T5U1_9BACT|nr:hypothetical protein [Roseivirga misakiensis]OEK06751.1 hypothetical protein BFP71_03565 [Roseivirga misakiensis]